MTVSNPNFGRVLSRGIVPPRVMQGALNSIGRRFVRTLRVPHCVYRLDIGEVRSQRGAIGVNWRTSSSEENMQLSTMLTRFPNNGVAVAWRMIRQ